MEYLKWEGQPTLNAPRDGRSVLRAERALPPRDPEADVEFRLELLDPDIELYTSGEGGAWRMYFEDVHNIDAATWNDHDDHLTPAA